MVYDNHFSSVLNLDSSGFGEENRITEDEWNELIQNGIDRHTDGKDPKLIPNLHNDWLTDREIEVQEEQRSQRKPIAVDEFDMRHNEQETSLSEGDTQQTSRLNDFTEVNEQEQNVDNLSLVDDNEIIVKEEKVDEPPVQVPQRESKKPLIAILRCKKCKRLDTLEPVPHLPQAAQNRRPVTRFQDEHQKLGHIAQAKHKI